MAKTSASKPSLIPAFLALLILGLFGYILFTDLEPGRNTQHDINPPIEIIDDPPPLTVIPEPDPVIKNEQEAEAFVEQLAKAGSSPKIVEEHGDQFVRYDSRIALPDNKSSQHNDDQISTGTTIAACTNDHCDISIKDIIQDDNITDNALFYVHRVTEDDKQGLWGIVQSGLINKFREGLQLEGISRNKDRLQAIIPANADEPLPSGLSSFLGKILADKVTTSYVYNFKTKKMGRDANLIHPGQQLIVIHFTEDELKQIYQFFSEQRNKETQSFAIPD